MANINLLPWREELREDRKQKFLIRLVVVVISAAVLLGVADRVVNSKIDNQNELNEYLSQQIADLDRELVEIRELRSQKAALTERMGVIQDLQGTRPVIVRLFDELVRALPEGVYYNTISRTNDSISLQGVAESSSRVSALMRDLNNSEWFTDPKMSLMTALPGAVNAAGAVEAGRNQFQVTVKVTSPGQESGV
jgi:type IV pilus assembly protein PilN